jgi:hypothetical protein
LDTGSRLPFHSTSRVMARRTVRATSRRMTTARPISKLTTASARAHTRSRTAE